VWGRGRELKMRMREEEGEMNRVKKERE